MIVLILFFKKMAGLRLIYLLGTSSVGSEPVNESDTQSKGASRQINYPTKIVKTEQRLID